MKSSTMQQNRRRRSGWGPALRMASLILAIGGLVTGLGASLLSYELLAQSIWSASTIAVLAILVAEIAISLRRGEVGLDIIAAISMSGSVVLGEALAGAVVSLMYAGGQFLELTAQGRARRAMTALLERAPRFAWRYETGGLAQISIDDVRPGDLLLIRKGDVLPVDGHVRTRQAMLDESALTGEPGPIRRPVNATVMSGSANVGEAFDLAAAETAERSTYAGILRLVEEAERTRAPMVRLADRYAIVLLFVTTAVAGLAWWISGDTTRALAVFVVATPCPLILAAPIAFIAGMSRAAERGVLIKSSSALEALSKVQLAVLDKTGTLTLGRPVLQSIEAIAPFDEDEALQLAASVEQGSSHSVAAAVVDAAHARGLTLDNPRDVFEEPGQGIEGVVATRRVAVGSHGFAAKRIKSTEPAPNDGYKSAFVVVDGSMSAVLEIGDEPRPEAREAIRALRALGIRRITLATGDALPAAKRIAASLGVDHVYAGLSPAEKVDLISSELRQGSVMMVGDGTNDAPALAAADVGIAMGGRGTAASAQTAHAVLLSDNLRKIPEAIAIARYSRVIAVQSIVAGLALSGLAMIVAAVGYLPPVQGALAQEAIDVAVIANAMRALRAG